MKSVICLFLVCAVALAVAAPSHPAFPSRLPQHPPPSNSPLEEDLPVVVLMVGNRAVPLIALEDESMFVDSVAVDESDIDDDETDVDDDEFDTDDEPSTDDALVRSKRQSGNMAMDLALSHQDRNGNDRRVGQLHGRVDANGFGQNSRNYHVNGGVGAGSVLWRSKNNRHSLGAGAYASQSRGRFQGYSYKSKPNYGAGIGYRFRF